MNGHSETSLLYSEYIYRALYGVNREIWLEGNFDSEVNGIAFHVHVDSDSAVVTFNSFSDACSLFRSFARICSEGSARDELTILLRNDLNITVYLPSRKFGIVGPNANLLLSKIFLYILLPIGKRIY